MATKIEAWTQKRVHDKHITEIEIAFLPQVQIHKKA